MMVDRSTDLALPTGNFRNVQSTFNAVSQKEASDVEEFRVIEVRLDFRLLQMTGLELLCGSESSAERSIFRCSSHKHVHVSPEKRDPGIRTGHDR